MLTDNETIVIEKEPFIDLPPKNRPRKVYGGMWGPIELATAGLGDVGRHNGAACLCFCRRSI